MSDGLLDATNIIVNLAYIACFAAAFLRERRGKLADLVKACQGYWAAAALAAFALVLDLLSIPNDGWQMVLLAGFTLSASIGCAVLTDRKRDRKAREEMRRDMR